MASIVRGILLFVLLSLAALAQADAPSGALRVAPSSGSTAPAPMISAVAAVVDPPLPQAGEPPAQGPSVPTGTAATMTAAAAPAEPLPSRSTLPIPVAPDEPARPRRFAAPSTDPAGLAARAIARRVAYFKNYRAQTPGAVWRVDPSAVFRIRSQERCLKELERLGVGARLAERELTTPVPTLVVLDVKPIAGVSFVSLHLDRQIEISCELATRLPALARILRDHGVVRVGVNSSYRDKPKVSFHTFGLALDIASFGTAQGMLVVAQHFEVTPDARTCDAKPTTDEGRALLGLICALADSGLFSSVLTPNYNEGHRDHVHLDVRPDDPRRFVR